MTITLISMLVALIVGRLETLIRSSLYGEQPEASRARERTGVLDRESGALLIVRNQTATGADFYVRAEG